MVDDAVEEVAVVGDDQEGALEVEEVFLEDVEGDDVEVVGGFVEDEQVGLLHQDGEQVEPSFFAAGEFADGVVQHVVREEELVEEAEVADSLEDGLAFVELHAVLAVVADLERFAPFDPSRRRLQRPDEQVDERTLPDAVSSHDPDPVVSLEFIAEVFDQIVLADIPIARQNLFSPVKRA